MWFPTVLTEEESEKKKKEGAIVYYDKRIINKRSDIVDVDFDGID